jgi:hypothetical protein
VLPRTPHRIRRLLLRLVWVGHAAVARDRAPGVVLRLGL